MRRATPPPPPVPVSLILSECAYSAFFFFKQPVNVLGVPANRGLHDLSLFHTVFTRSRPTEAKPAFHQ